MRKTLKHIISLMIAGLCINNLPAQTITLSAEINWKEKDVYFLNYDKADVPFLKFTYRNNTADSIYFYNSLRSDWDFSEYLSFSYYPSGPFILADESILNKWKRLNSPFPNWSDNEYLVTIEKIGEHRNILSSLLYKNGETNIGREDIEKSKEHDILQRLTELLRMQLILDRDSTNLQYECFHHPDKLSSQDDFLSYYKSKKNETTEELYEKTFKINVYDNCVFLKPYESFSFEYDLTPFFLLKGSYNFIIQPPPMPEFVQVWDNNNIFPKEHSGYKLFTGQLNSVDIRLTIPPFEQAQVLPSRYINIFQNGKYGN